LTVNVIRLKFVPAVEIRDVLPTFLNAAGVSSPSGLDGASLLRLVRNPDASWRSWIELEHDVCYAQENHWNALSDGGRKYIFHAMTGEEQFFNLETLHMTE
jgi:arylsulfatase